MGRKSRDPGWWWVGAGLVLAGMIILLATIAPTGESGQAADMCRCDPAGICVPGCYRQAWWWNSPV